MKYFVEFDIQNTIKQEQESGVRIFHDELNRLKDNHIQTNHYSTAPLYCNVGTLDKLL